MAGRAVSIRLEEVLLRCCSSNRTLAFSQLLWLDLLDRPPLRGKVNRLHGNSVVLVLGVTSEGLPRHVCGFWVQALEFTALLLVEMESTTSEAEHLWRCLEVELILLLIFFHKDLVGLLLFVRVEAQ